MSCGCNTCGDCSKTKALNGPFQAPVAGTREARSSIREDTSRDMGVRSTASRGSASSRGEIRSQGPRTVAEANAAIVGRMAGLEKSRRLVRQRMAESYTANSAHGAALQGSAPSTNIGGAIRAVYIYSLAANELTEAAGPAGVPPAAIRLLEKRIVISKAIDAAMSSGAIDTLGDYWAGNEALADPYGTSAARGYVTSAIADARAAGAQNAANVGQAILAAPPEPVIENASYFEALYAFAEKALSSAHESVQYIGSRSAEETRNAAIGITATVGVLLIITMLIVYFMFFRRI